MAIPSALDFRNACKSILDANAAAIKARMDAVYSDANGLTVLNHYSLNFDTGSLPIVVMEQKLYRFRWVAQPSIGRVLFRSTLWGFVWHNDPNVLDDLCSEFAAGVFETLNSRHLSYSIPGGNYMFFNDDDQAPLGEIQYGAIRLGSNVLRGWQADWTVSSEVQILPSQTLT